MNYRLVVNPRAARDAEEAAEWYEKQSKELGKEFINALDAALKSILDNPNKYALLRKNFRRVIVNRFPFGIFYLIENDTLVVLSIWHFKRKPFAWLRKEK